MDKTRPLRTDGTDAERLLLAAGLAEKPDSASVRRAAESLGLFPRLLVFVGLTALALRSARWTTVIGPLACAGAIAAVAYQFAERPRSPASTGVAPAGATIAAQGAAPIDGEPAPSRDLARALEPTASLPAPLAATVAPGEPHSRVAAGPRTSARLTAHATPVTVSADSLREQAELLDHARARLASGDAAGGLALLDDYDRRFVGAALSEESLLLRVEALARRGDRNAAALGHRFLKAYPASVHAGRVSALLHSLSP